MHFLYSRSSLITSEATLFLTQDNFLILWKVEVIWRCNGSLIYFTYFLESFFILSDIICLYTVLFVILLHIDFPLNLSVFGILWMSVKNVFSSSQFLLLASKPSCHYYVFIVKLYTFINVLALSFFLVGMVIFLVRKKLFIITTCSSVWPAKQTIF